MTRVHCLVLVRGTLLVGWLVAATTLTACTTGLPHAPATEQTGIDEEIAVAESEEAGETTFGVRGRALVTVLALRDRATPFAQVEVDAWLRKQISTFAEMTKLVDPATYRRVAPSMPESSPYRQAEHAYARWVQQTRPDRTNDEDFATTLFTLDDATFPDLDRATIATEHLSSGSAMHAALQYLERSTTRATAFYAHLKDPASRHELRHVLRRSLGAPDELREERSKTRCRSAQVEPSSDDMHTFLVLWQGVESDRESWDEGVRALVDLRLAQQSSLFVELGQQWTRHPDRRAELLYILATLTPDGTDRVSREVDFVPTSAEIEATIALDARALLVLPRILGVPKTTPRARIVVDAVDRLEHLPDRIHYARDPSVRASIASYAASLCAAHESRELTALRKGLEKDGHAVFEFAADGRDLLKCTNDQTSNALSVTRAYGSDC